MMHVKKGDQVIVIAGNDKGRTGEIKRDLQEAGARPRRRRQLALEAQACDPAEPQGRAGAGRVSRSTRAT